MKRMRCAAKALIVAVFAGAGMAFAGGATTLLVNGVDSFLLDTGKILGAVFAVVMGLFAFAKAYNGLFIAPVFEKMETGQRAMIAAALVTLKESFADLISHHVQAQDPHPVASDRMHEPLFAADREILAGLHELRELRDKDTKRLAALIHSHNLVMGEQQKTIDAIACIGHRNPHQTPFQRRESDPDGTDFTDMRGHKNTEETLVPEEEP